MKRKLLLAGVVIAGCSLAFAYGVLVGAREYPPYYTARAVRDFMFAGRGDADSDTLHPRYRETDPSELITLRDPQQVDEKRTQLISILWGSEGLPLEELPHVIEGIDEDRYTDLANLQRIDQLTVEMDFALKSRCYHFIPRKPNGKVVIYHQGHRGDFFLGKETIKVLLESGCSVVGIAMPLKGMNNQPIVRLPRFGRLKIERHDQMKFLESESGGHPVRLFVEPVVVILNYLTTQRFDRIGMMGISGGGWTTVMTAAVDIRVHRSYSVSGSLPIYLRSEERRHWGDYEQSVPELYRVANYMELYILGSTGTQSNTRRHTQVVNKHDARCFFGLGFQTYEGKVAEAVRTCGAGSFAVLLDETHREHKISDWAVSRIISDFLNDE